MSNERPYLALHSVVYERITSHEGMESIEDGEIRMKWIRRRRRNENNTPLYGLRGLTESERGCNGADRDGSQAVRLRTGAEGSEEHI